MLTYVQNPNGRRYNSQPLCCSFPYLYSRALARFVYLDLGASLTRAVQNFMSLAIGHNARQPLPGPAAAADALRKRALAVMEEWNDAHGHVYKGLRAAYRFLRESKRMQFPELQVGRGRGVG